MSSPRQQLRFDAFDRILHVALMISFLGLAFSGMPMLFADRPWASRMVGLIGGYAGSGLLHRVMAASMIITFVVHLLRIVRRAGSGQRGLLWGPNSLVPQPRDLVEMLQHFRWFVGRGPRPRFDRFTYWEKFDYWAVFWGMGIIGFSGLMLWFPAPFSKLLPGWTFNVAQIVHGEEAVLAMVFIFTVHFFNGHLRPRKFPMDPVIFTGRVDLEEIRHERPAEYARILAEGTVEAERPAPRWVAVGGRVVGGLAVVAGWVMAYLTLRGLWGD